MRNPLSGDKERRRSGVLRPLADREFRLLWSGQTASLLGDGIFSVALAWQALNLSPTGNVLAVVLVARALPRSLLLLLGGVISDRISRRKLMLGADVVQGLVVLGVALLAATGTLRLWQLVTMAAVTGTASAFFFPASTALLPDVVSGDDLAAANALNSSSRLIAIDFAGPVLGGILVTTLGPATAFAFDALTFALSAVTLSRLRPQREPVKSGSKSLFSELLQGLTYTRQQRWIWLSISMIFAATNVLISGTLSAVFPLLIRYEFRSSATSLGFLYAAFGAGSGVGALVFARLGPPRRRLTVLYAGSAVASLFLGLTGIAPNVQVAMIFVAGAGFLFEVGNLVWATLLQERVPRNLLGRVSSVDWFVSLSITPIAVAVAGSVAEALGGGAVVFVAGIFAATVIMIGFFRLTIGEGLGEGRRK